ncbi:DUF2157 domain-containing protein [Pseudaestuariivita sp.]|uniref:DUF2157 domain-containing protein n=1 Tax=Pseudaestuariivita sp. TaxID=2211669 RepID=UPI004058B7B6
MRWLASRKALHAAVDDWEARGVLPRDAAGRLREDLGAPPARRGFGAFVVLAGVACLVLGALRFVAANWDAMPRLVRLGLLVGTLWGAWGGAVYARHRGWRVWYEAGVVLACGLFGAAVMLVSQMYHIQGDASALVRLWVWVTLAAAAVTGARAALVLALVLGAALHMMELVDDPWSIHWHPLGVLVCAGALAAWWRSLVPAHLVALGLGAWAISSVMGNADAQGGAYLVVFALAGLVAAAARFSLAGPRWLGGFEGALLVYALLTAGLVLVQPFALPVELEWINVSAWQWAELAACVAASAVMAWQSAGAARGDLLGLGLALGLAALVFFHLAVPVLTDAVILLLGLGVVLMGYRADLMALRVLGGLWVTTVLLVIYAKTLGDLLSTAAFFVGAGLVLLLSAGLAVWLAKLRGAR